MSKLFWCKIIILDRIRPFVIKLFLVLIWVLEINMKKVLIVIERSDISRVKTMIEENIGNRVKITVKKGRKRITVRYGTIKAVYPHTFNVLLENISAFAETQRAVSLNYADVLTGQLSLLLTETNIPIE